MRKGEKPLIGANIGRNMLIQILDIKKETGKGGRGRALNAGEREALREKSQKRVHTCPTSRNVSKSRKNGKR